MLLNVDGLDKKWTKGVKSAFEGRLGWHDEGDVENYSSPLIFRRVNNGVPGHIIREYDCSSIGIGTGMVEYNVEEEDDIDDNNVIRNNKSLITISNKNFRNLLVNNFHKQWEKGQIVWPSRTGIMEN